MSFLLVPLLYLAGFALIRLASKGLASKGLA